MPIEQQDTWRDADDAERDAIWRDLHPFCARCGVECCKAAIENRDRCMCNESVGGGVVREGSYFCGETCAEAYEEEATVPISVFAEGRSWPSLKAYRQGGK
jgi:hypothetical protein